jgi:hypothetical protein
MFIKAEFRIQNPEVRIKGKKRESVNAVLSLIILDSGFWILNSVFRSGFCFYIARKQATLAIACFLPQLVSPVKGGQARLGSIVPHSPFSNIYFERRPVFSVLQKVQNFVNPNTS